MSAFWNVTVAPFEILTHGGTNAIPESDTDVVAVAVAEVQAAGLFPPVPSPYAPPLPPPQPAPNAPIDPNTTHSASRRMSSLLPDRCATRPRRARHRGATPIGI